MDPSQSTSLEEEEKKKKDFAAKMQLVAALVEAKKKGTDRKKIKYYEDLYRKHEYWDKQPTLRIDKHQDIVGSVQKKQLKDVRKVPLDLPDAELHWCDIDVNNAGQLQDLYDLLTNNYVEDEDNTFRFDYSREFLRWSLTPPNYKAKWHVGIRDKDAALMASITGIPVIAVVEGQEIKMAEINFLCVHKKYRAKNLSPLLISQVTRRVNMREQWQAIYTSGKNLPTPFTRSTYFHRSLNPKKLLEVKFSALGQNQTLPMIKKLYSLPQQTSFPFRPMTKKDVSGVTKLINECLKKYVVKLHFSEEEVAHFFIPRQNIIYTYVLENIETVDGKPVCHITDMLSFYSLPSHVMGNPKHNRLNACYSFYNFCTTISFVNLMQNSLILAKSHDFDVFNCLNLMENQTILKELFFQMGDGCLNYYLYNWIMKSKHIEPEQLGVVLF